MWGVCSSVLLLGWYCWVVWQSAGVWGATAVLWPLQHVQAGTFTCGGQPDPPHLTQPAVAVRTVPAVCCCCCRRTGLNEFVIVFFITIGSYQAVCNIYRVSRFQTSSLPAKVRGHRVVDVCGGSRA